MANLYEAHTRDEIIRLLENGADINAPGINPLDRYLRTPFIHHCSEGNEEAVITLIEYGCDVLLRGPYGDSGLEIIIRRSNSSFLLKVLQYEIIRNMINMKNQPYTPLQMACGGTYVDIFDILIEYGADINLPSISGRTPLMAACLDERIDFLERLIALNVDVNAKDNKGHSALFVCLSKVPLKYLMIGGIDLNSTDNQGHTALLHWMNEGLDRSTLGLIKKYIDYGGNINAQDIEGKTALMYAVDKNSERFINLLLRKSADVDIQDNEGKTALMYAIEKYRLTICEKLIEAGSDLYLQDNNGQNAIRYASQNSATNNLVSRYLQVSK